VQTYFGVVDKKVSLRATCSTDTEIDYHDSHQQLTLQVDCGSLPLRSPEDEIKLVVLQNRRWDGAVIAPSPTSQMGNKLLWEHCHALIFPAGNEYRKFEALSTRYPGMHAESMRWFEPYYHLTLQQDFPRTNYLYDEDRNGLSVVRCEGSGDADTEADYVLTHFSLAMPYDEANDYYVSGRWATTGLSPEYKMIYNAEAEAYEATLILKLGYYNYLYLAAPKASAGKALRGSTLPAEGSFAQTENEYEILVYYRPTGSRYWQLVNCITPLYRP